MLKGKLPLHGNLFPCSHSQLIPAVSLLLSWLLISLLNTSTHQVSLPKTYFHHFRIPYWKPLWFFIYLILTTQLRIEFLLSYPNFLSNSLKSCKWSQNCPQTFHVHIFLCICQLYCKIVAGLYDFWFLMFVSPCEELRAWQILYIDYPQWKTIWHTNNIYILANYICFAFTFHRLSNYCHGRESFCEKVTFKNTWIRHLWEKEMIASYAIIK